MSSEPQTDTPLWSLVDSMLVLVMGGGVPKGGYAILDGHLFRNQKMVGRVSHLTFKPHGTEVHYWPTPEYQRESSGAI